MKPIRVDCRRRDWQGLDTGLKLIWETHHLSRQPETLTIIRMPVGPFPMVYRKTGITSKLSPINKEAKTHTPTTT